MSMHEIEDMVEGAVRVLDKRAPVGDAAPRSQFAKLYEFQEGYDCGFTHFRVMDLLLARRFTYRFDLEEHPDFKKRGKFFKGLKDFTFLHDNPADDTDENLDSDEEPSPVAGYVEPPDLYCDAGSPLWRRMVEAGKLKGPDAEAPTPLRLFDVVYDVMLAAEAEGDRELIAMWFNMGPKALFGELFTRQLRKGDVVARNPFTGKDIIAEEDFTAPRQFSAEELQAAVPHAARMRELVRRTNALAVELAYDYRPPLEALAHDSVEAWWWQGL
ncbi:hypothetical protein JY651_35305 [Pyxidicoccus parkwayensis]|jgi:hypothetical protein|uniref:Uncharacterized protein n=1 Tax=Pyxidicoccus parkwayensis TaxID=2813578 RepID=A0ABX7NSU3_9BACT|nr:hypothetical protein [Pyxidicoccus parkwaysis]QSQ20479.1 hypothetical protein JY651_35305 [Pyxidicoccus parkwaysis]